MAMQSGYPARGTAEIVQIGFSPHDERELETFFGTSEADAGLRSSTGSQIDAIRGAGFEPRYATSDVFHDVMAERIDEGRTGRWARIRRRLAAMAERGDGAMVVVIYRLFGPIEPGRYRPDIGDPVLSRIADLTDVADAWRDEMALHEGETRERRITKASIARVDDDATEYETWFWEAAGRLNVFVDALRAMPSDSAGPRTAMLLEVDATHAELECWLRGFAGCRDGVLAARITAMASGDLETTHAQAIRERLADKSRRDAAVKALRESCQRLRLAAGQAWTETRETVR